MKMLLPAVLLFASATAVDAQQREQTLPDPVPVVAPSFEARTATPAVPVDIVAPAATETEGSEAGNASAADAETRADQPVESAAMVQDTPRNFWWLVGGIVLAGIILAVIL